MVNSFALYLTLDMQNYSMIATREECCTSRRTDQPQQKPYKPHESISTSSTASNADIHDITSISLDEEDNSFSSEI